eukprot:757325-Hanusia_phi.AAC.1
MKARADNVQKVRIDSTRTPRFNPAWAEIPPRTVIRAMRITWTRLLCLTPNNKLRPVLIWIAPTPMLVQMAKRVVKIDSASIMSPNHPNTYLPKMGKRPERIVRGSPMRCAMIPIEIPTIV